MKPVPILHYRRPFRPDPVPALDLRRLRQRGQAALSMLQATFLTTPDSGLVRAVAALVAAEQALLDGGPEQAHLNVCKRGKS